MFDSNLYHIKRSIKISLEVLSAYVICAVFAFGFSRILWLLQDFGNLWLLLSPCLALVIVLLLRKVGFDRFLKRLLLSIVGLSLVSDLMLLIFNLCNIEDGHTPTTGGITILIFSVIGFLFIRMINQNQMGGRDMIFVLLVILTYEVASRIEVLSIPNYLNMMFNS